MDALRRNHVSVRGHGASPLVFGHGFGCDQRVWERVQPHFETSHRCVLFDYVGCGRSEPGEYDESRYETLDGYAQDLLEVCGSLELHGATFIGHSVSAMIGVLAEVAAPGTFSRMVLLAPSPRYIDDPPYIGGFTREDIAALLTLMDQNFVGWATSFADLAAREPRASRELTESLCSLPPGVARRFAEATFFSDCRPHLPQVQARTLVIQCSDDDIAPVSVGQYVASRLPKAEYRLLSGSGHLPHVTHAGEVIRLVEEFLTSTSNHD